MACSIDVQTSGPFSPEKIITGKIICFFNATENIEEINCYLNGEERIDFTVGESNTRYKGVKSFLRSEIEILQACTFQAGTYKYPFSFELPARIPSSYQHEKGKVVYEITAEVSRGAGRFYRDTQTIEVSVTRNLNDMGHEITMRPVTYPLEEMLESRCCCYSAHVFLDLNLEKDGFLVGEDIKINFIVHNVADVKINDVALILESHTEFTAQQPRRRKFVSTEEICKKSEGGQEGSSKKLYSVVLKVPKHLKIPCLRQCKLIRQWHSVTALIKFNDCYNHVRLPGYIKLGHLLIDGPRPPCLTCQSDRDIPIDINSPANRLPYPLDDSHFPSPHPNHKLVSPAVHRPASYNVLPSAPLAETEVLLSQRDTELPPTYDEATHNIEYK